MYLYTYIGNFDLQAYTFALQLSHENVRITAAEFFVIDASVIFGVIRITFK